VSLENGGFNKYTFSIDSQIPLQVNDKISFKIPAELKPPTLSKLNCKPAAVVAFGRILPMLAGLKEIECLINKQIIEVTIKKLTQLIGNFEFILLDVRNPISTKPSEPFEQVKI